MKNIDRFKTDLQALISKGELLDVAMQYECFPEKLKAAFKKHLGDKTDEYIKGLPSIKQTYQTWYSESLALLRQILPDRIADFVRHYEKPKSRKEIDYESYRIEDYMQGLQVTRGIDKHVIVGADAAIPHLQQQIAIVKAAEARFTSSLFEIRQIVQADLLDSEIEAAEALVKYKFIRAAGALAGVVLERHLGQVCEDRKIPIPKKNSTIADYGELLKANGVIDVPQWRFVQHLADIRNLCDHSRKLEPTTEQATDLIEGVKKVTKTVY